MSRFRTAHGVQEFRRRQSVQDVFFCQPSAAEADRDLRAFSSLREAKADPLPEELKIPAGASYTGFTVFSFPVSQEEFAGRKSLTVRIETYDHPAIELKQ